MDFNSLTDFIVFLLILGGLIFVHELGHFVAARRNDITVDEFGFGFPPRLVGMARDESGNWRFFWFNRRPDKPSETPGSQPQIGDGKSLIAEGKSPIANRQSEIANQQTATTNLQSPISRLGTIYSLNMIPLGGFVRPGGEDDPSVPGGLAASSKLARFTVLIAGVTMNLIVAYLVFAVGFKLGWPDRVGISEVAAGSPAETAGLQSGDVILRADGKEIHYSFQLTRQTYSHLGVPLPLTIRRGGQTLDVTLTPRTKEQTPAEEGPMGIRMQAVWVVNNSWPESLVRAGREIGFQFTEIITLPGRLLKREIPPEAARLIGLKGIYDLTGQAVADVRATSQWFYLIQLIGSLSVALAFTNLLPLPALDGGRILFVLLEAVRGRRIAPEREGFVHALGFVVLLALMLVINVQDFLNPVIQPR